MGAISQGLIGGFENDVGMFKLRAFRLVSFLACFALFAEKASASRCSASAAVGSPANGVQWLADV